MEMLKNVQPNNENSHNIVTNTNSNNTNRFNLNFFLNETCKNAMNLNDFVDTIKLDLNDFESMGRLGYVEGLSNIIIKRINDIPVHNRPFHCNDIKRESMHIRLNNVWEKEPENKPNLKKFIKQVGHKNLMLMQEWIAKHPQALTGNEKESTKLTKIMHESTGGITKEENDENDEKIITKIAHKVAINKR
jgi:hypothetical protein